MEEFNDGSLPTDELDLNGEGYLMQQLKDTVLRRKTSMERVRKIYEEDPRASDTPLNVGLKNFYGQNFGGRGEVTMKPMFDGMAEQKKFLFENKLNPELLQLKEDDADPFTKMLAKVQSNNVAKARQKSSLPYSTLNMGNGVALITNKSDGSRIPVSVGSIAQFDKIFERHYKTLIDGGVTDVTKARSDAFNMAKEDFDKMKGANPATVPAGDNSLGAGGPVAGMVKPVVPGSTPAMVRPAPNSPGPLGPMNTEAAMKVALNADPNEHVEEFTGVANLGGARDGMVFDPVKNAYVPSGLPKQAAPATPTAPGAPITIMSAQQKETHKQLGESQAKENTVDRETLGTLRQMEESRSVMAEIMNSGKNTAGQLHETVNKLGGYMNYIDPNNSLAEATGNDAVYFSQMMNLVRDKIKALGSGTAVSNLDLIVTQKSVGDLRNTPEGNKKLLAIMELQNATMEKKLTGKLDYFDQNKTYDKYRASGDPTHLVRATRLENGDTKYWVQTREGWINERVKRGDYKSPEAAAKAFNSSATKATAALVRGTGITMREGK